MCVYETEKERQTDKQTETEKGKEREKDTEGHLHSDLDSREIGAVVLMLRF